MKAISVRYEDFKRIIDDGCYYVDKTPLINEIVSRKGMVTLFTRPRRFGKTLALSMIRTFFENEIDRDGNQIDNSRYFEGMKIMQAGDDILSRMGQYPVIKLSLKSAKQPDFQTAFLKLREEIIGEFERHLYILNSDKVSEEKKKEFNGLYSNSGDWFEKYRSTLDDDERSKLINDERGKFATSLKTLSECLKLYHGRNAIILLDEYDVPLENAYYQGFYDEMVGFIRSLFESALKTNDALEFAVVTGCLRISKESIFTGLNNLVVNSIRGADFGEYFGFTQAETESFLTEYGLHEKVDEVRDWYDGYLFGDAEVYNPWSVTMYAREHVTTPDRFPEPYWSNTSSNSIIKDMVERADDSAKDEIDTLIAGGTIEKQIHEDITYEDIYQSDANLWNFLFFTGYMKKVSERIEGEDIYVTMRIPNKEIRYIYRNQVKEWFERKVKAADVSLLHNAIKSRDIAAIEDFVSNLLAMSISYYDSEESFYHGFFLSLLYGMAGYTPKSNREEGVGRPDIVLYPLRPKDPAYIFELKVRKKFNEMEDGLQEAYDQIRDQRYEEGILDDGYAGVISYGVCFCKKSCIAGVLD